MEMTAEWTRIMQKQIGRSGWFDAFGELHMAYCSKPGQQANGQFFTPSHICELMVMCAAGKKETGQRMGDPTCGSGRLLLAYHAHNPGNYLVGEDISRTCCMMTVCNMLIHGCIGEVICHDSLQPRHSPTDGKSTRLCLDGNTFYKTHEGRGIQESSSGKYRTLQRGSPYHQPIGQIITNHLKNIIMEL